MSADYILERDAFAQAGALVRRLEIVHTGLRDRVIESLVKAALRRGPNALTAESAGHALEEESRRLARDVGAMPEAMAPTASRGVRS